MTHDAQIVILIGKLEEARNSALKLAKCEREGSKQQKRLLDAYALLGKAQDEITLAGANV